MSSKKIWVSNLFKFDNNNRDRFTICEHTVHMYVDIKRMKNALKENMSKYLDWWIQWKQNLST